MSNYLAVATVTASLRTLVSRAIQAVPGAQVSTIRPDGLGVGSMVRGVNIFLYMVAPNLAFENEDAPLRNHDGVLVQVPRTALDLHYLFTFYGDESRLEPQLLLGTTLAALRQQPIITPALIAEAIRATSTPDLTASDLADQLPHINVRHSPLSFDALTRAWSIFYQVPYSLSASFEASVAFVDSPVKATPAKPTRDKDPVAYDISPKSSGA